MLNEMTLRVINGHNLLLILLCAHQQAILKTIDSLLCSTQSIGSHVIYTTETEHALFTSNQQFSLLGCSTTASTCTVTGIEKGECIGLDRSSESDCDAMRTISCNCVDVELGRFLGMRTTYTILTSAGIMWRLVTGSCKEEVREMIFGCFMRVRFPWTAYTFPLSVPRTSKSLSSFTHSEVI